MVGTYRTSSTSWLAAFLLVQAAFTGIGVWALTSQPSWFLAGWCLLVGYGWWFVLCKLTYRIRLSDEGTCEFQSLLITRRIRAQAIISVTATDTEDGIEAIVRYQGGKICLWPAADEFRDFLDRVKELNPTVEVVGFSSEPRRDWQLVCFAD